jgi:hypothetical protein
MYQATVLFHKLARRVHTLAWHACLWCHWQNFVYQEGTQQYTVAKAAKKGPNGQYF